MTKSDNKPAFVKRDTLIGGKDYAQLLTTLKARFRRSQLKATFPGHTGFSVTNIKEAKRWYEFYNQSDMIRQ